MTILSLFGYEVDQVPLDDSKCKQNLLRSQVTLVSLS